MIHLDRPMHGFVPSMITQPFANVYAPEPLGYLYSDGSIGYEYAPGATHDHLHNGVDYGLLCGTPLYAPADGVVSLAGRSPSGFGLRLVIDHGEVCTLYGHLTQILVKLGVPVKHGQKIALSGGGNGDWRDGNSTGCHLHWSVLDTALARYYNPFAYVFYVPPVKGQGICDARP